MVVFRAFVVRRYVTLFEEITPGGVDACKEPLEFAEITNCKSVFWVNSQTVLTWIKTSPRKFKPFVSVRVAEIIVQETLDTQAFKYIRSASNPADILTRGAPPEQLKNWMEGSPPFLWRPEEEWPKFEENSKEDDKELSKEMKSPISPQE